jgi:hypothetical protein
MKKKKVDLKRSLQALGINRAYVKTVHHHDQDVAVLEWNGWTEYVTRDMLESDDEFSARQLGFIREKFADDKLS